jgi:hypothetical protein
MAVGRHSQHGEQSEHDQVTGRSSRIQTPDGQHGAHAEQLQREIRHGGQDPGEGDCQGQRR